MHAGAPVRSAVTSTEGGWGAGDHAALRACRSPVLLEEAAQGAAAVEGCGTQRGQAAGGQQT